MQPRSSVSPRGCASLGETRLRENQENVTDSFAGASCLYFGLFRRICGAKLTIYRYE